MKVLMVNHPESTKYRGGDTVQLRKTAQALQEFGVEVTETTDPEPDGRGYDLAHVFNLRTADTTARQVESLHKNGIPIALTPFFINNTFANWALAAIQGIFGHPRSESELDQCLEALRQRRLRVVHQDQELTVDGRHSPWTAVEQFQQMILSRIDYLLPNSFVEMDLLVKTLRGCPVPFRVVPSAVDPTDFHNLDATLFEEKYGFRDFVLQVSRIEANKNQLFLMRALRSLDLPVVLIGEHHYTDYFDWCRKYGPRRLLILPWVLPHNELLSAYRAARVHVLPGWVDTCGLVSLEAALADCNVVVSFTGCELEYFRDYAYYCDPLDADSIRQSVVTAYENYPQDAPRRQAFREWILHSYTWKRSAELTYGAYRQMLERRAARTRE